MILTLLLFLAGADSTFLERVPEVRSLQTGEVLSAQEAEAAPGVFGQWQTRLFDGSNQSVSFVRVRPEAYDVDVLCAEGAEADSTSALCQRYGAQAGINGSYYNMRSLTHVTYVMDEGEVVGATLPQELFRTNGLFCSWTGRVEIGPTEALTAAEGASWREAIASGPVLVDDGRVITYSSDTPGWDNFYARRHPRSLVGTDAAGCIWLVVVDGRARGHADGMTIAELTILAGMMGLTDALNLDGGGSSSLWTRTGGVISHPSNNWRFDYCGQRPIPSVLAVREK